MAPPDVLAMAEAALLPDAPELPQSVWHDYLEGTRSPRFLLALEGPDARRRWAETTFQAIRRAGYTLEHMLTQRARTLGSRAFLREARGPGAWSYEQARRRIQAIATVLHAAAPQRRPRVAILSENSVDSACTDLACLAYDIFVTPLDVHFDAATLAWIFDRLQLNLVVTSGQLLADRLEQVRTMVRQPFRIAHIDGEHGQVADGDMALSEACSRIGQDDIAYHLGGRIRSGLDDTATVMFTSGSTGRPKGVEFTAGNLLTKRFARGAALPSVGEREVLLCYLPLFHTFGRYLELMGSLYWGGTYVFAGNPSSDHLIALLQEVRPTGLISIPLRWVQIRDACLKQAGVGAPEAHEASTVQSVIGGRLRWGLSAAGHLDPRVFRFFHRHGIEVCSGFGMTEATGGITMTPPGEYVDESVGVPLPGIQARLTGIGELQIAGPYVARYLDAAPEDVADGPWLSTGDLFREHPGGFLEIVDRVKDIYKNAKGQTIAPRKVESQFEDVPGVKRVFLVGDGREYNTLLIVPDRTDPVLQACSVHEEVRAYFHQLIATANKVLARYERVVNFAVLERDFETDRGELTPKGSYRRKVIQEHFAAEIADLYRVAQIQLDCAGLRVRVPRWLFRDQGWLDSDVTVDGERLVVRSDVRTLRIHRTASGRVRIGALEYAVAGDVVDLGLFARQPLLWIGNPELASFCPCKDGWDVALGEVGPQVFLPEDRTGDPHPPQPLGLPDDRVARAHTLSAVALFGAEREALNAVQQLSETLQRVHDRFATVIRRRLESLARHPALQVRALAYRCLLLDTLVPESSKLLPSFVDAGMPFLNDESIELIARANLERRRLEAFRQRLYRYRTELRWPATAPIRAVFADILRMLGDFVLYHPDYFYEASLELNAWILHDADPELSQTASEQLARVTSCWQQQVLDPVRIEPSQWDGKLVLHDSLSDQEQQRMAYLLRETPFLQQSVVMAFEGAVLTADNLPPGGVWVSRLVSMHQRPMFRVSINTRTGKHYDLLVMLSDDLEQERVLQTIRWMLAVSAYPFGAQVVPRVGWYSPELRALSLAYIQELTVHERIRELASSRVPGVPAPDTAAWRKLFIRAMTVFFAGWRNSGARVVPGPESPANVVVPEPDFREGAIFLSMSDWKYYESPLSIVRPLIVNFYEQTASHLPWCAPHLDPAWIFDACMEALGADSATAFLRELRAVLERQPLSVLGKSLAALLDDFLAKLVRDPYEPFAVSCAAERYEHWRQANPGATSRASEQFVEELMVVYGLDRFPEIARYQLFRRTYFAHGDEAMLTAFDRLLAEMFIRPLVRATSMVELSDLQASIADPEDRSVFTRMAFPHARPEQKLELLAVGCDKRVIVRSHVTDHAGATYTVREPLDPSEVGKLYRLYVLAGFPKSISQRNCFYVALDSHDEIIGGAIYAAEHDHVAHLRGIVVNVQLKGRGLNAALLEDFCRRMADQGIEVVRTFYFARGFFIEHGFRVDRRWGGLVRILRSEHAEEPGPAL